MIDEISKITRQGAKELNITLPPESVAAFRTYNDFLKKRGEFVNLTTITDDGEVARLHFLDSLALLNVTQFHNKKVIDIGSGAGFPGLPLKLAEPTIDLTLLDAKGKRVKLLSELCSTLGTSATCLHDRAEEAAHRAEMREQYDICVSRAVARLNVLCELCLPFVRVNGLFIAMKSTASSDESKEAESAISALGGELQSRSDYTIPGSNITHRAILIQKVSTTSDTYPRRFARIRKSPL